MLHEQLTRMHAQVFVCTCVFVGYVLNCDGQTKPQTQWAKPHIEP